MADNLSQTDRTGTLTTPAGEDTLALTRFDGAEALSENFLFRVEAVSEQENFDFSQILGLNCAVTFKTADQLERYFNGVLVEARWFGRRDDLYVYQLVLKPWLWLLSRTSDCRIFSSMKAPDIIKKVFQDRGFSDYRDALTGSYPTLEYTVQYRETDMNFVCRLMEEYGIYYFFEHAKDKHTLVLADGKSSHKPVDGLSSVQYLPATQNARRDAQLFDSWTAGRGVQTGRYVLNDYDYEKPGANLLAEADKPGGYAHDSMEMFDYPRDYDNQGDGKTLAKAWLDADQSRDKRFTGLGYAPSLFPGALINLEKHPTSAENREYLVVRSAHVYGVQDYRTSSAGDFGPHYTGSYELTPSDRQFRAPLVTPKAIVHGVQSALVVGKQGEEIDVDEEGRICVQFYWDRKKKASRRVRVAQIWAGSHRGALFLPRIGDEVLIQYEEGDPDRPVVVGSVYNGANKVVADLPAKKTRSGILTKSSKNSSGYNMLLFDDTAGDEHVKLRAQKALMFKSLGDETRDINGSQTETIGGDETITVGGPSGGGTFTLTAQQKIVLQVMGSSITIDPTGITLQAPNITFTADATLNATAGTVSIIAATSASVSAIKITLDPLVMVPGVLNATTITWGAALGSPPIPPV